jgi:hypothetical protein
MAICDSDRELTMARESAVKSDVKKLEPPLAMTGAALLTPREPTALTAVDAAWFDAADKADAAWTDDAAVPKGADEDANA